MYHNVLIMSVFHMWMVGYHHFNFFSHQNFLIKKVLGLMLYKTKFLVLKVQKSFTKTKT